MRSGSSIKLHMTKSMRNLVWTVDWLGSVLADMICNYCVNIAIYFVNMTYLSSVNQGIHMCSSRLQVSWNETNSDHDVFHMVNSSCYLLAFRMHGCSSHRLWNPHIVWVKLRSDVTIGNTVRLDHLLLLKMRRTDVV